MKKFKIVSKVRFTVFAVLVILCIITAVSTIAGNNIASSSSMSQYKCVQIESGDTLWNIAKEYKPAGKDVRQVVYDICQANDISADDLSAGEKIIVPVYQ
jgi:LysM repeat protein